ncbi:MAG: glycosyltransferase family A protein [Vulcanimicrobiota bacterium]
MKISIVIPTFNRLESLKVVLPSLLDQTYPASSFEILLCDAGSQDGTAEWVASLGAENLRFLPGADSGRAGARNRGLQQASGEVVLFTDADIIADRKLLESHAMRHQRGAPKAVVGCEIQVKSLDEYERFRLDPQAHARHKPTRRKLPWHYFLTGNASAPRDLLIEVGGFDQAFQGYGHEDLELGYRLARRVPIEYAPEAINYHWHPVPFPEQCSKMFLAGRSTVTFYRKHKDWRIRLQMGWNPLAMLWFRLIPKDGLLYQYFEKRLERSHFARELILQHHYLSGIRSAL